MSLLFFFRVIYWRYIIRHIFPEMFRCFITVHDEAFIQLFKPVIYNIFITLKSLPTMWIFQRQEHMEVRWSPLLRIQQVMQRTKLEATLWRLWQQYTCMSALCVVVIKQHTLTPNFYGVFPWKLNKVFWSTQCGRPQWNSFLALSGQSSELPLYPKIWTLQLSWQNQSCRIWPRSVRLHASTTYSASWSQDRDDEPKSHS